VHLKWWIINLYHPSKPVTLIMQNLFDWKCVPLEGWKSCMEVCATGRLEELHKSASFCCNRDHVCL